MQKHIHLVDLVKSFHTRISLQQLASIQQRTSPSKLGGDFIHSFLRLLRAGAAFVSFDAVMAEGAGQEAVFTEADGVLGDFLRGYNVSIIAYGQTGSGTWWKGSISHLTLIFQ